MDPESPKSPLSPSHAELSESDREGFTAVFKLFDPEGDGSITFAQFAAVMQCLHRGQERLSNEAIEGMYLSVCDGVGDVHLPDFLDLCHRERRSVGLKHLSKWKESFALFDGNSDGTLSLDELYVVLRCLGGVPSRDELWEILLQVSPEGGGALTFPQYLLLLSLWDGPLHVHRLRQFKEVFGYFDQDGSGTVSAEELDAILRCMGTSPSAEKLREMIHDATLSVSDDTLHFHDFLRLISSYPGTVNIQQIIDTHAAFSLFDKNGDGNITTKELANVFRALGKRPSAEELRELVARVDEDKNGTIEFPEFLKMMAKQLRSSEETDRRKAGMYEESLCGECQSAPATLDCMECHESYCKDCCPQVHSRGKRRRHCNFTMIQICGECSTVSATKECTECNEYYCDMCCREVHDRGRRKAHSRIRPIDRECFRAIDFNASNAFGLHVAHDLTILRFTNTGCGEVNVHQLPPHMREAYEAMVDAATIYKEHQSQYIDPDHTSQQVTEPEDLPHISIGLHNTHINELAFLRRQAEITRLQELEIGEALQKLFVWRRPHQVDNASSLFPAGNDLLNDWPQCLPQPENLIPYIPKFLPGCFNDSWLLLALATVATNRDLFRRLFVSTDYAEVGVYAFQFYSVPEDLHHEGDQTGLSSNWTAVVIDNLLPLQLAEDGSLSPTFGKTQDPALWLTFLMKAYAKFRGSYSYLHCGSTTKAMRELTGGITRTLRWNTDTISADSTALVWWQLMIATRLGLPVVTAHMPSSVPGDGITAVMNSEEEWGEGEQVVLSCELTPRQTVDFLGVRKHDGLKFIKLRNLYGRSTSDGDWDWGPSSSKWNTKRVRRYVSYTRVHECISWITVGDFVRHFNAIALTYNYPSSPYLSFQQLEPCAHGREPCHAHQYLLAITPKTPEDPQQMGLADALQLAAVVDTSIYNPPDFRMMLVDSSDDDDGPDEARESQSKGSRPKAPRSLGKSVGGKTLMSIGSSHLGKKCLIVKIFLSQPPLPSGSLTSSGKLDVNLFRLPAKGLQIPEETTSDIVVVDNVTPATKNEYRWPVYNQVDLETCPVNEPTNNTEKLKELEKHEGLWSFAVTQPGLYVVTVEQGMARHDSPVDYCLAITSKEGNPADPTDLISSGEFMGSYVDPLITDFRADHASASHSVAGSCSVSRSNSMSRV